MPAIVAVLFLAVGGSASAIQLQKVVLTGEMPPGASSAFGSFDYAGAGGGHALFGVSSSPRASGVFPGAESYWTVDENGGFEKLIDVPALGAPFIPIAFGPSAQARDSLGRWYLLGEPVPGSGTSLRDALLRITPGQTPEVLYQQGASAPALAPPGGSATVGSSPLLRGMIDGEVVVGLVVYTTAQDGTFSSDVKYVLGDPANGTVIGDSTEPFAPGSILSFSGISLRGSTSTGLTLYNSISSYGVMDANFDRRLLVELGNPIAGLGTPSSVQRVDLVSDTEVALTGRFSSLTGARETGVWLGDLTTDAWRELFTLGDPAPGTNGNFGGSFSIIHQVRGDAGRIWVITDADDRPGLGLWATEDDGTLDLVMRTGDALSDGEIISQVTRVHTFEHDRSALVDLNDEDGRRLVFLDSGGLISTILESGEAFTVAQGDSRIVSGFRINEMSGTSYAMQVFFADGSEGIFLATVPEPGTGLLTSLGLVAVAARTRVARGRRTARCASTR